MKTKLAILVLASAALSAAAPARPLLRTSLRAPVKPACISSSFGPRVLPNEPEAGSYHYGVDLPAPAGSGVYAAAAGTVIRVQHNGPGGIEMLIQHDGFVGIYSHFELVMPDLAVPGRRVAAGEQLGFVGSTGVSSGPHVYFAMMLDGKPVDPAPYLRIAMCNGSASPARPTVPADGGTVIDGKRYWTVSTKAEAR